MISSFIRYGKAFMNICLFFLDKPYPLAITVPPLLETRKVGYNERKKQRKEQWYVADLLCGR